MMQAAYKTYDSYKDSGVPWLGEIPEDWDVKRNLGLFDERKEINYPDSELLSVTIEQGIIKQSEITAKKDSSNEDKSKYKRVLPDDLAYNKMRMWQGAIGRSEYEGIVSPAYIILEPRNKAYSRFYHYVYRTALFIKEANRNSYGLCDDMNSLRYEDFKTIYSPVPPEGQVNRIVAFLDQKTAEIDAAIEKKQRLIELLKEQKSILINQAVTKGLNASAPMKDSGIEWIGHIPAHWEVKKVRHLGTLINGISEGADYFGSGHPFVTYGDVYSNFTLPEKLGGLAKASKSACNNYSVKRGDVFFTRTSEIAEEVGISSVCLQTVKNATFSGFVIRFRPFTSLIEPEFSGFYFRSDITRAFFVKEMNLVTRVSLGQNLLKNLPVMIPPQKEQIEISKYLVGALAEVDSVVETSKEQISQLKEFKQTLIAHAVTGKIKV